jgi:SAM-dependent methyltransferase
MAHMVSGEFLKEVRAKYKDFFKNKRVLDIGSADITGSSTKIFNSCKVIGLDVAKAKNVDVICIAHKYNAPNKSFDVVLSFNALEHDMYYKLTLKRMTELLKPNGLMIVSVARKWGEHGTRKHTPAHSLTSQMPPPWCDYYKNLRPKHIEEALDLKWIFKEYTLRIDNLENCDTQFCGIKRNGILHWFNIYLQGRRLYRSLSRLFQL